MWTGEDLRDKWEIDKRAVLLKQAIGGQIAACLEAGTQGWRTKRLALSRCQEQRQHLQGDRLGPTSNMPGCIIHSLM